MNEKSPRERGKRVRKQKENKSVLISEIVAHQYEHFRTSVIREHLGIAPFLERH